VRSRPIEAYIDLSWRHQIDQDFIPLPDGLQLQVIHSIAELPRCRKHQCAAFIRDAGILVVWDDDPKLMIQRTEGFVQNFMAVVWKGTDDDDDVDNLPVSKEARNTIYGEPEAGITEAPRTTQLLSPLIVMISLALMFVCFGLGARKLAIQSQVDGDYTRFALLAVTPLTAVVSLVRGDILGAIYLVLKMLTVS
jgi:hypothetical protein